jgi:predicted amidophosphoribosyltransferase
MLDQEAVARLGAALVSRAGGYLRNPVREDRVTCAVCATPVDGYERCFQCGSHGHSGLADAVAFSTYAVAGQQSGYVMRGYKARPPLEEHRTIVTLLILLALSIHAECPGRLAGAPVTHWATVPSLPAKPGEHPLHEIVSNLAAGSEAPLGAAAKAQFPRDVNAQHFSTSVRLPPDSHVLLIDDTWVRGGRAQSAALALRTAGAAHVSALVVARWIKEDFSDNAKFLSRLSSRDYDPGICPWTGSDCP